MQRFTYCPSCKTKIIKYKNFYKCESCGFTQYIHSYPTGSAFVIKNDKVLLAIRAGEPHKGEIDIGGGFCNYGEHPKKTAIREIFEETTLKIKILDLLGVYMDTYDHKGKRIKTLNFVYIAKTISGTPKPKDDVASLDWYNINKPPFEKMAFKSQKQAMRDLQKWHKQQN